MSSLVDIAYRGLREKIMSGELPAGSPVHENTLAKQLNVSRTPVREAISRLTSEGLIAKNAGQPSTVQSFTLTDFIEILHLRRVLESEAAALAARRPNAALLSDLLASAQHMAKAGSMAADDYIAQDDRLHGSIAQMAGSQLLANAIRDLRVKTRIFDLGGIGGRLVPSAREHIDLLSAIISGDAEAARDKMAQHIDQVRVSIIQELGGRFDR